MIAMFIVILYFIFECENGVNVPLSMKSLARFVSVVGSRLRVAHLLYNNTKLCQKPEKIFTLTLCLLKPAIWHTRMEFIGNIKWKTSFVGSGIRFSLMSFINGGSGQKVAHENPEPEF